MEIIGLLGGMGHASTAHFYAKLVTKFARMYPVTCDQDYPRIIIDGNCKVPDRTAFLLGQGEDPRPALIATAIGLEKLGARLLGIPCNTANVFSKDIQAKISIPIFPWIEEVVASTRISKPKRIGLLATTGTIQSCVYQDEFKRHGIITLTPNEETQQSVMKAIYSIKSQKDTNEVNECLMQAEKAMKQSGVDGLLLACTELSIARYQWTTKTYDALDLAAERLLLRAI